MKDIKDNAHILVIIGIILVVVSAIILVVSSTNDAMDQARNVGEGHMEREVIHGEEPADQEDQ